MARDLNLAIDGDDAGAKRALSETARGVDKLADQTGQLGRAFDEVSVEATVAAERIDDVGDQAKQSARAVEELQRKMLEAKIAAKALAVEFAQTGSDETFKKFRTQQSELSKLSSAAKVLTPEGNGKSALAGLGGDAAKVGTEAAGTFASAFEGGLLGTFKALPPEAKAALGATVAGAAIAAAPFIVSVINGAILAGVGAGGLAAGIALAAKDPEISGAFKALGSRILTELGHDVEPFKAQLLTVADSFGSSFGKIAPNLKGFFATLAPSVSLLGDAIGKAFELIGPALERSAGPASQVLAAVAAEIPEIAGAIATLLDDISAHGDSAAAAFKFVLFNVEALITAFDVVVRTVGPAADVLVRFAEASHLVDTPQPARQLSQLAGSAGDAAFQFNGLAVAEYNTADAARAANDAFKTLFGTTIGLDEANLNVKEGFLSLSKTIRDNNGSLDDSTAKGQANREAILSQVRAIEAQREAAIAAGNGTKESVDKANAAYLAQLQRLRDVAAASGANTEQLDAMLAAYNRIPRDITVTFTTVFVEKGQRSPNFNPGSAGTRRTGSSRLGANERATGGPVVDGQPYLVGEHGPELFWPNGNGSIVPTAATSRMLAQQVVPQRGNSGGRSGGRVTIAFPPENLLEQAIGSVILKLVQNGHLSGLTAA